MCAQNQSQSHSHSHSENEALAGGSALGFKCAANSWSRCGGLCVLSIWNSVRLTFRASRKDLSITCAPLAARWFPKSISSTVRARMRGCMQSASLPMPRFNMASVLSG